jgi:hypothetical protein
MHASRGAHDGAQIVQIEEDAELVIRGHQRSSVVISGHQRSSEVISTHIVQVEEDGGQSVPGAVLDRREHIGRARVRGRVEEVVVGRVMLHVIVPVGRSLRRGEHLHAGGGWAESCSM